MAQPMIQQSNLTNADIARKFAQAAIQEGGRPLTLVTNKETPPAQHTTAIAPALTG